MVRLGSERRKEDMNEISVGARKYTVPFFHGSESEEKFLKGKYQRISYFVPEAFFDTPDEAKKDESFRGVVCEVEILSDEEAEKGGGKMVYDGTIPFRVLRIVEEGK